jgi:hypothetical protein
MAASRAPGVWPRGGFQKWDGTAGNVDATRPPDFTKEKEKRRKTHFPIFNKRNDLFPKPDQR